VTMVIDHTGFFFFPQEILFRVVGRLSFLLFAWLVANGAKHTKNINAYLGRLFIFGLLSQIPYTMAFNSVEADYSTLNVMFTLLLGLLGIKALKARGSKYLQLVLVTVCALAAHIIDRDYGMMGVLSVVFFYLFFDDFKTLVLSQVFVYVGFVYFMIGIKQIDLHIISIMQPLALVSLFFVAFYNGRPGPKAKYLFYVVYPLQFLVFYLLAV